MDKAQVNKEMNLSPERQTGGKCAKAGLHHGSDTFHSEVFLPWPVLRRGHVQTIASHVLPRKNNLPAPERRLFRVEPDVQIACDCHWQTDRRSAFTTLIVHGLEGSSESQYVIGTANKAWSAGMNVVRMNVRNCGGTESLAPTLYHSGMSADVGEVVRELVREEQLPRLGLAGFSMGGNQVLKLAGEWGQGAIGCAPAQLRAVAAISPAMDLSASADALHLAENRLYEWRFLWSLRGRLRRKQALFPGRFAVGGSWWRSIRDFDDKVTAVLNGFRDAEDYYQQASSSRLLQHISVPTLVVHSNDDPFIRILPGTRNKLITNPNITYVETAHGGHCGFLAAPNGSCDGRWAEVQIVNFFLHQDCRNGS